MAITPIDLPDWIYVDAPVVELEFLGADRYSALDTTVARVTAYQVVTAAGGRFWLKNLRSVGYETARLAGINATLVRLVPPNHPRIPRD